MERYDEVDVERGREFLRRVLADQDARAAVMLATDADRLAGES